jgi:hypothetical protein
MMYRASVDRAPIRAFAYEGKPSTGMPPAAASLGREPNGASVVAVQKVSSPVPQNLQQNFRTKADSAASIQQLLTDRYQVIRYCCDTLTDTRM